MSLNKREATLLCVFFARIKIQIREKEQIEESFVE